MPNIFGATGATQVASAVIAGLYDQGVLAGTIYRDPETDFVAGKGDSVTVRAPVAVPATNFTGTATPTDINEGKVVVNLDHMPYSQTFPNQKEQTLYVEDFYTQVLEPQVAGIAEYIENAIATELLTTGGTASGGDWPTAIAAAAGVLTTNRVPSSGRYLAVSGDVLGALLGAVPFASAADSPNGPQGLQDATIGRYYGFDVVTSTELAAGSAIAYHTTAVTGVFRTPTAPQGAGAVANVGYGGITAQVIYAYDNARLSDGVTALTLFGLGTGADLNLRALKVSVAAIP